MAEGGQFALAKGGQFNVGRGGQFAWFFQAASKNAQPDVGNEPIKRQKFT